MRTRLTDLVGCTTPIQQAPMGTVSSPRLAVAVAEAGGIGSINTLAISRRALKRYLDEMCEQTDGALAVSFLTNDIDVDAVADAASRVRVVDFFWCDPRPDLVDIAHRGGALVIWQVGSAAEARAAAQAGSDAVCAQGVEAGGHCRGDSPLLPLLSQVLDAVDVPVLAAGGIADARASLPFSLREPRAYGWARDSSQQKSLPRIPTMWRQSWQQARTARASPTHSTSVHSVKCRHALASSRRRSRRWMQSNLTSSGRFGAPMGRSRCRVALGYHRPKTSAVISRPCVCTQVNPSPSSTASSRPRWWCLL